MQAQTILSSALLSLIAAGALGAATSAHAADKMAGHSNMEKCYGINAAMKNDCQTPGHSCAGQDSKARDPQGFVAVPAGLCAKIAGGSLQPMAAMSHDAMKKS
ncbi:MAG TPA: DUF2282 domain-containing protein [Rhodanobacter sp.]